MNYRRTVLLIIVVAQCAVWTGCASDNEITVTGEKGTSAEAESAIQELVIRHLIAEDEPGRLVFVSFGTSWNDDIDPSPAFLARLGDVGVTLKPVSQCDKRAYENPVLLVVRVATWTSETEARLSATRFRFGAGGAEGFTANVEWESGIWKMTKRVDRWST